MINLTNKGYKIHSVKYNFIMNVILKMSSFIFPLITFPYVSRVLGAVGNGKVSFATSVIYYFSMIATLGIPTYGVKICAQYREDKEKLSKTVKELLIIESLAMIVSYIIFFIALYFVPRLREEKTLMLINSATILLTVFGVEWFYQAIEQYDYITFRNLVFKIISISLMFLLVHETEDYVLYGAINVLGTVGSNILNILRLRKLVDFKTKCTIQLSQHIRPVFMLFMLSAASMVYTSLDTTMLGFMKDDAAVGYYNAAVKLKNILVSLVTSLGTVLLPRLSNSLANKDMIAFNRLIKKSFNFVLLMSIPLTIYCIIEASDCINFLAGSGYQQAILPMQLISIAIIFIGLSNIIGIQILIPCGKENLTVLSTVVGAIVNIILNSILIPLYSAAGAALATTIAELSVLLVQVYFIRSHLHSMLQIQNIFKIFISGIVATLILLTNNYFIHIDSTFLSIIETGFLFFITYGVILIITREQITQEAINNIIKKFKSIIS